MKYPNSLLYKVSGNGLRKPSWLYGTIHMICASDFELKPKVVNALLKCNYFYMEVDLGNIHEMELMEEGDDHKKCYLEGLTEEEKDMLNRVLEEQYETNIHEIRELSPMYLINRMTTDALGCHDYKMMEVELLQLATENGIVTGGLETAREQLAIADKVFDGKELLLQLTATSDYKEMFPQIVESYKSEKLSVLSDLVNDEKLMSKKAYKILVTDRNMRWAKEIPKLIKDKSTFIAIGAGHLPGETGIINLLRDRGFSVNPVYR